MFRMGPWELALVALVILIVFGAGKLPVVAKEIGKGISSLRKGVQGDLNDDDTTKTNKS